EHATQRSGWCRGTSIESTERSERWFRFEPYKGNSMDVDRTTVQPALAVVLVRRIVGAEMSNVADVFAVLDGCVLLFASVSESVLFKNQAVHQGVSEVRTAALPPQRWWSFHLGVYSVFLGAAPIIGVIAEHTLHPHVARTLV